MNPHIYYYLDVKKPTAGDDWASKAARQSVITYRGGEDC
jgi:hypothetical protein